MCVSAMASPLGSALFGGGNKPNMGLAMLSPLAALATARRPDRAQIMYPHDQTQRFGGGPNSNGSIS